MGAVITRAFLAGRPRTKGHMTPRGNRGGVQDRELLHVWMRTMGFQLQRQLGIKLVNFGTAKRPDVRRTDAEPYAGPVEVHCFFRFERQESVAGGPVASHSTPWPTVIHIGDEDTLRRAVLDALVKNGVIKDDSMSIGGMNYKRWCVTNEVPGVLVVVKGAPEPWYVRQVEETVDL